MNFFRILLFTSFSTVFQCAYIEKNGYKEVTISFSESILKEYSFDFLKLRNVLTNASDILFHATKKRSYFEDFLLVVPSTWAKEGVCDEFTTKMPSSIDVYVTDSSDISVITAQHSKGCGEKGEIIYLPKERMADNRRDLALQFVQQWSIFRYGVFSENPERPGSCIASSDFCWSPTGCYNIDLNIKVQFDENGLPFCYLPNDFKERDDFHSSIMFSATNSSKMLNFCDGSETFPHNPVAPTLHNRICNGNSVWSVIKNTEDFKYGRNLPMRGIGSSKKPTFLCFKESKSHLTFMIQDTDSEARSEIRYALFYFLSIIEPVDFAVSLATFSSSSNTDDKDFINIDFQNKENIKTILESRIKLNENVVDICLTCGLRKAYKVSETSKYSLRTIIVIARESSLDNTKISEMTEIIQKNVNSVLHILFLEDTTDDIIPSSLVDVIQNNGGRIFRLKNEPVFMLSELTTALLGATKNILHVEDKIIVVHKKTYANVTSDISDAFVTPKNTKGKLLYSMQFKKRGDMKYDNCKDMDNDLQSPICGSQIDLNNDEEISKVWNYSFRYVAGSEGTTCSSLALLKLESSSKNSFIVKGRLNENKVTPGKNAQIIYAEIYNRLDNDIKVEAIISGPGLKDFRLELRDNGNGDPDIIKGDNIYSRYFTSFSQKGTYTVLISAEALVPKNDNVDVKENSTDNEMKVKQIKTIGTFRVIQAPPNEDVLPPNKVCDLKIVSIDSSNKSVLLQWTAPGDDYDYGRAKKYIIKASEHWMAMMDFAFNLKENILLETEKYLPANSGVTENLTIMCHVCNINEAYYIALQSTDNSYNTGKVSNILQIYFNDANIPSTDEDKITTETSQSISTISFSDLTETSIKNTASVDLITTVEVNTTENQMIDGIYMDKNIFIIIVSSLGTLILIIIILNVIACYCCCIKQHSNKPKKLSKKASLQPPHNLNIAYKHGSESSLNDEEIVSNSLNTLADQSIVYPNADERVSLDNRYRYHTNRSLRSKMKNQSKRDDLGFKLVEPMPAYATSSLTRFVAKHKDLDNEIMPQAKLNTIELPKLQTDDTHIYPLGQV